MVKQPSAYLSKQALSMTSFQSNNIIVAEGDSVQRVLSGEWRGMTIPGRPTTSLIIRLAVFNIWSDKLQGALLLD
eukprot:scaffold85_cov175-Ochromonas_danica.AAC.16